jgi:hypothetical protein|nr:MAG TPA: protein of unknown function DUF4468 [Caudoviricetes sp.]
MRILVCLLFVFIGFNSLSQSKIDTGVEFPMNKETGKYEFMCIDTVKGKLAPELYELAKKFLIYRFNDKDFFIDDKNLKIGDNGNFPVTFKLPSMKFNISYTSVFSIVIQFKDSRYRVTLTDFKINTNANATTSEVNLEDFFINNVSVGAGKKYGRNMNVAVAEVVRKQVDLLFSDLSKYLKEGNTTSDENDDW